MSKIAIILNNKSRTRKHIRCKKNHCKKTHKTSKYVDSKKCYLCSGKGYLDVFGTGVDETSFAKKGKCNVCNGLGKIRADYEKCDKCKGNGYLDTWGSPTTYMNVRRNTKCSGCNGKGLVKSNTKMKVKYSSLNNSSSSSSLSSKKSKSNKKTHKRSKKSKQSIQSFLGIKFKLPNIKLQF